MPNSKLKQPLGWHMLQIREEVNKCRLGYVLNFPSCPKWKAHRKKSGAEVRKRKESKARKPSELQLHFQPSSFLFSLHTPSPLIFPLVLLLFLGLCVRSRLHRFSSSQSHRCLKKKKSIDVYRMKHAALFWSSSLRFMHFFNIFCSTGAQIIDLMVLVVDVVKGVQTQTAECLLIGELTCPRMVVVLNKTDLLPPNKRQSAIEKMTKRLHKTLESTRFVFLNRIIY